MEEEKILVTPVVNATIINAFKAITRCQQVMEKLMKEIEIRDKQIKNLERPIIRET